MEMWGNAFDILFMKKKKAPVVRTLDCQCIKSVCMECNTNGCFGVRVLG